MRASRTAATTAAEAPARQTSRPSDRSSGSARSSPIPSANVTLPPKRGALAPSSQSPGPLHLKSPGQSQSQSQKKSQKKSQKSSPFGPLPAYSNHWNGDGDGGGGGGGGGGDPLDVMRESSNQFNIRLTNKMPPPPPPPHAFATRRAADEDDNNRHNAAFRRAVKAANSMTAPSGVSFLGTGRYEQWLVKSIPFLEMHAFSFPG